MSQAEPPVLTRSLGSLGVVFLAFSALSPAASVYIYGAGVIRVGGTGAIAALIIGGALAGILGLLYGEVAAAFPSAGGVYPSFKAILGPHLAFPFIAMMMMIAPTALAFLLLGFADYVRVLAPSLPELPVALVSMVAAAGLAVLSIRTGALLTGMFLTIELAALAILTVVAFLHPWVNPVATILHPVTLTAGALAPLSAPMLGLATVAALFTCGGATWALYFAEEMTDAERRIGRVVNFVSPVAAASIALPIIVAVLAAPDRKAMMLSDAPIAEFLRQTAGPFVTALVSAAIVLAVFNAIIATIMGYGRLLYSTGRDGIWPRPIGGVLARLSPRFNSPVAATAALCGAAALMMMLGERTLLILSSNESIVEYALLDLAVVVGRRRGQTGLHHRVGLHPAIPILSIIAAAGLVVADWIDPDVGRPSLYVLAAIVIGSLAYYHYHIRPQNPGLAPAAAPDNETGLNATEAAISDW